MFPEEMVELSGLLEILVVELSSSVLTIIKIGPKDLCSLALKRLFRGGVGIGRGLILHIHLHVNKLIIKIQISRTQIRFGIFNTA